MRDAAQLSGLKILVVDDSNTIRRSAEIFLKQAGCQVILAEDGFDGLAKVADHEPDLIFCDILMPRLDGYKTCALIKKSRRYRGIPVVMLSSRDSLFDRARGRIVDCDDYLTKPFTKDALLGAVADHAGRLVAAVSAAPTGDAASASDNATAAAVVNSTATATVNAIAADDLREPVQPIPSAKRTEPLDHA